MARKVNPEAAEEIEARNLANLHMLREALGSTIMIGRRADVTAQSLMIDFPLVNRNRRDNYAIKIIHQEIEQALDKLRKADAIAKNIIDSVSERAAMKGKRR